MSKTDELEWIIKSRLKIQEFLLRLYLFADEHYKEDIEPQSALIELLVGIGFSLWRAAFLHDEEDEGRPVPKVNKAAKGFLHQVMRDNNITYGTEKEWKAWTSGYFINNAYFRLHLAYQNLSRNNGGREFQWKYQEKIDTFLRQQAELTNASTNIKDWWDTAYEAMLEIFEVVNLKI